MSRCQSRMKFSAIAARFRAIYANWLLSEVSPGDLHPGNLLVDPWRHSFTIIDYSSVWCPDLSGRPTNEIGIPSYQHPERLRSGYWGRNQAAFAARVIHLSLLLLAANPTLWRDFHIEGENLLFTGPSDFESRDTAIWKRISDIECSRIRFFAEDLWNACEKNVSQIPAELPLND